MIEIISGIFLWAGAIITLIGSLGMLRFREFYSRTHAAGLISVGGFSLSLIGIIIISPYWVYITKTILILSVNLLTNPTATHALADSAYNLGIVPSKLARNDLKGGAK